MNKNRVVSLVVLVFSVLIVSSCTVSDSAGSSTEDNSEIFVNQIGYYTDGPKRALIFSEYERNYSIADSSSGEILYSGAFTRGEYWPAAEESISIADFSDFAVSGTYRIILENGMSSHIFTIGNTLYTEPSRILLKSFYYQRAGTAVAPQYGGRWHWKAGHLQDNNAILHSSTGQSGRVSSPGGWYDAGDYGKYIVNGGITVGTLLAFHELFPDFIGDDMNIPESANGVSDLLDEVKYELEWMLTMQDADGGVFFKLSGLQWPGMILPAADTQDRYIIGKSTTSTLNFAACMAMAARIYEGTDSLFSDNCEAAAENAWNWALDNPDTAHPNTGIPGSGPYDDSNYADEFLWAAAELFITTGENEYQEWLSDHSGEIRVTSEAFWANVKNLGILSLIVHEAEPEAGVLAQARESLYDTADRFVSRTTTNPARIPMDQNSFGWGSHGGLGNKGIVLAYAHYLSQDRQYGETLIDICDYLSGRNVTGYSCSTGIGDRPPMNPHHRPSEADGVPAPVPGLVVGGPNPARQDGQYYPHPEPARCYVDVTGSYSSNEPAINQNASVFFSFGYLGAIEDV